MIIIITYIVCITYYYIITIPLVLTRCTCMHPAYPFAEDHPYDEMIMHAARKAPAALGLVPHRLG